MIVSDYFYRCHRRKVFVSKKLSHNHDNEMCYADSVSPLMVNNTAVNKRRTRQVMPGCCLDWSWPSRSFALRNVPLDCPMSRVGLCDLRVVNFIVFTIIVVVIGFVVIAAWWVVRHCPKLTGLVNYDLIKKKIKPALKFLPEDERQVSSRKMIWAVYPSEHVWSTQI